MKLLLSLCNQLKNGYPPLFLLEYDLDRKELKPIALDHPELPPAKGISGLAYYGDGFVAVLQVDPVVVIHFTREYRIKNFWRLPSAINGHSIAVREGRLYVVSTGTDSVVAFGPKTGESIFWQANDQGGDTIHLNSLACHRGNWVATQFGTKKAHLWSSADMGRLVNLGTGQTILAPLYHPHTVYPTPEGLYVCESCRQTIHREDGQSVKVGAGYLRGLVVTDSHLYIGASKGRSRSHTTGEIVDNPGDPGTLVGGCGVLVYQRTGGGLAQSQLIDRVNVEKYAQEIYDILLL